MSCFRHCFVKSGLARSSMPGTPVNSACVRLGNLMSNVKLTNRIQISLIALAATYVAGGVSVGFRFWDFQISLLFLIWSLPFFAVAWIVTGVPIIAAGNLVLRIPVILVVLAGGAAGVFVLSLLPLVDW